MIDRARSSLFVSASLKKAGLLRPILNPRGDCVWHAEIATSVNGPGGHSREMADRRDAYETTCSAALSSIEIHPKDDGLGRIKSTFRGVLASDRPLHAF